MTAAMRGRAPPGRSDNSRMRLRFTKMQGAGNDFVVLDATRAPIALSDKRALRVQTVNNTLELRLQDDGRVSVDMNTPIFDAARAEFDVSGLHPREVNGFAMW